MFKPSDLFDLAQSEHAALFEECQFAWEALRKIPDYLKANLRPEQRHRSLGRAFIGEDVFIGEGTVVEEGAMILGPTIIGRDCQVRHNAYVRGNVIAGDSCVLGNACEFKNCFLFNRVQVPHFSYVGDSILGFRAHLGAGVKISNVKLIPANVMVLFEGEAVDTGLRKFGAILGDRTDIGCNTVLNPGSIIGAGSVIYPGCNWRGVLPPNTVAKNRSPIQIVTKQPLSGIKE